MDKNELIDALKTGYKNTKADAGRYGSGIGSSSTTPRSTLANVAALWNVITESEQLSWNDNAVNFPFKNKFGDYYTASGYQVFMKLNSNMALINNWLLRTCPIANFPQLPPIEPPSGDPPELLRFTFPAGIPSDIEILTFACNGVLRGSGFRKGKEKLLGTTSRVIPNDNAYSIDTTTAQKEFALSPSGATFTPGPVVLDCTYAYQNLFGQLKPNSIIYFRFVAVSRVTGQVSVERIIRVINAPNPPIPRIGFYLPFLNMPGVSAGKEWITPFRVYGFNLTAPLLIETPVETPQNSLIGRTVNGPWVNALSVPLNELNQPRQNVFFIKTEVAAPGLAGGTVNLSSTGATSTFLGFGQTIIAQFMADPSLGIAFGDVYSGLYTILEVPFAYGALRADILLTLLGPDSDRFQIGLTPDGPFLDTQTITVRGVGADANAKIYLRTTPGAIAALSATLRANSGGDLVYNYHLTANSTAGVLTSPMSPGVALGNQDVGIEMLLDFQLDGAGIASGVGIIASSLVNCTVSFSELISGPFVGVLGIAAPGGNLVAKQIFMHVTPIALGAFSFDVNMLAAGTSGLTLAYTGTAI